MEERKMYLNNEFEIDVLDLVKHLVRKIYYIIVISIIGMVIGGGISLLVSSTEFVCTTTISIIPSQGNNSNLQNVNNYLEILQSSEIKNHVLEEVNLDSMDELNSALKIENPQNTSLIQINATTNSENTSTNIVKELISTFETEVGNSLGVTVNTITDLVVSEVHSSYSTTKMMILGLIGGFIVSCIFFVIRYLLSGKFHTEYQIEASLALPVLIRIPFNAEQ